jgi:small subunit ribosomal protein S9
MKAAWVSHGLREGLRCTTSSLPIASRTALRRHTGNASLKAFSTSTRSRSGIAAPEIDFGDPEGQGGLKEMKPKLIMRLVPESPSYFTAQPEFTDGLLRLESLLQRYSALPQVQPGEAPRIAWRSLLEYRNAVGEAVKASKYHQIVNTLNRLNQIHPSVIPTEVTEAMNEYKRVINSLQNFQKPTFVDQNGKALGVGRRKSSTARAWVVEGTGEILINGKTLAEMFGRIHDRESAIWALKATERIDKYNVWALVSGGGTTGQAEALTLAVAKALLAHEPSLKPALRRGKIRILDLSRESYDMLDLFFTELRTLLTCFVHSRLRYPRHEESRKEEARPCQSQKDASLG